MSIGYACIVLDGSSSYNLRGLTLKNISEERLSEVTVHNLQILENIIDYNIKKGIKLYRISSDIIPFGSHYSNSQKWWAIFEKKLTRIGDKIKASGIRVSMHPGQYTVLNSMDSRVVRSSVLDLQYHTRFLDSLKIDCSNKIILHIGGVYGDKNNAVLRFSEEYNKLPKNIKNRLVIENDEKSYNINEVLAIGKKLNIPVVFDNLHHKLNPPDDLNTDIYWINSCSQTWVKKDGKQKIHYSQQDLDGRPGAHSKTIKAEEFLNFYKNIENKSIDIMLEVKDKNLSAIKCIYLTKEHLPIKYIQEEWARYEYLILSHSLRIYLEIQWFLKNRNVMPVTFFSKIEEAVLTKPSFEDEINAANQVWSLIQSISDIKEVKKMQSLLENYKNGKAKIETIKKFLYRLSIKYNIKHLLESYYFIV